MLGRVSAAEVVREATSGRTRPLIMSCDSGADEHIEVFCKISDGCEEGVVGLAREVVAACIAGYLDLPVPAPWLVDLPAALPDLLQDVSVASRIRHSSNVAFGSTFLRRPFSLWPRGKPISRGILPVALGTFVFDAVIENGDRRTSNPNCLVAGQEIRLIDHELAFPRNLIRDRVPPWELGGMQWLKNRDQHIFLEGLRKQARHLDFGRVRGLWLALSDRRLNQIRAVTPPEWADASPAVEYALGRIRQARINFDGVIDEVQRVLK